MIPIPTWYSTKLREVIEIHIACWGPSFWTLQWQLESRMEAAVHRSARHGMVLNHLWDAKKSPASWKWWVPSHCGKNLSFHVQHICGPWFFIAVMSVAGWIVKKKCILLTALQRNLTTERSNQTDTHGFVNYPPWKRTWHFEDHPFLIGDTSSNIYLLFHCHLSFAGGCTLHWNRNRSPGNRARPSRIELSFVVFKQMARWNW